MNRSTDLYVDGKRHILVADDEMINREMLENILCDEYDVLLAEDGEMAYDQIVDRVKELRDHGSSSRWMILVQDTRHLT